MHMPLLWAAAGLLALGAGLSVTAAYADTQERRSSVMTRGAVPLYLVALALLVLSAVVPS